ncbi:histidine phosphatase family protein [Actinokineospora globicatena]|uniref:histidine phosphatase family protein n=1 Tax=Actinokineospora globicatena TaxID=103729 RepID=UPI0020A27BF5|nr:histidine phosphatase family protein [Actinokineospora globicatena]MCP2306331.1 2,3-bisphosphoglycerate-dependent phosphoglycerate mutase [Actinokineospora globicatena]GLW81757.1 phosphoglycerate mutase [Actinokineospora globicatena]GLW88552.1 phosphoglycerate mutase [Actinokineospora globicatena]
MSTEIVLVRHAHAAPPTPDGPDDHHRPLTAAGTAQAEHLVAILARFKPTLITSSPYLRAVQTLIPTARALGMTIHTTPTLREWDSGLAPTSDYAHHYAESWSNPHTSRPNAESLHQLTTRATTALRSLTQRHHRVLVATHGTFISRALLGLGQTTIDWPFSNAMPSPARYRLHFTPRGTTVTGPGL